MPDITRNHVQVDAAAYERMVALVHVAYRFRSSYPCPALGSKRDHRNHLYRKLAELHDRVLILTAAK
ncbi:hypothetical protein X777_14917 [Ooceraea biroi]|uniref:Uncharacterized protein n=1 Tax=Ooceraea biroi TaxID=2015173 RepID=A0A026WS26_OOCBI|nr:hypothetical protein X777_14917 [Ooceraea biroi]